VNVWDVFAIVCVWLIHVQLPGLDRCYEERKLLKDTQQINQLFPCRFLPKVLEMLIICVLGVMLMWVFSSLYRLPSRIVVLF
jgi:hypothetical protein